MTYKLYYHPNTASLSTHWVLIELESHGIEHTLKLVDFPNNEQSSPAYLSLNPKGRVPTLLLSAEDDSTATTESSAILLLLSELHSNAKLAPPPGHPDRAKFLEVYMYISNQLLPALRDWVYADKDGDKDGAEGVRSLAQKRITKSWEYLNKQLEGRKYLLGDEVSVADFLAAATVSWTKKVEEIALAQYNENVRKWCKVMRIRKSWSKVVMREEEWVRREPPFEKDFK